MKPNIGTIDRIFRLVLGISMIAYGIINKNWIGAIGIIPLFTGLIRWCPLYCPIGMSTIGKSGKCGDGKGCCGGGNCSKE